MDNQALNASFDDIQTHLREIRDNVMQNPKNLEPVIIELTLILNKFDPGCANGSRRKRPLFQIEIDSQEWIQKIRDVSKNQDIGIRQIRYKSEELSKKLLIPLPNGTKNHQEPLLYWYKTNWAVLEPHLMDWNVENDPINQ